MEGFLNIIVCYIVIVQTILSILMSIFAKYWMDNVAFDDQFINQKNSHLNNSQYSVLNFFTYFLLMNTLLPISMMVQLEVVKWVQKFFIDSDYTMYCDIGGEHC